MVTIHDDVMAIKDLTDYLKQESTNGLPANDRPGILIGSLFSSIPGPPVNPFPS